MVIHDLDPVPNAKIRRTGSRDYVPIVVASVGKGSLA